VNEKEIMAAVDKVLAARAELIRRGVPAGDVIVMTGTALGILLAGGKP
jgi:hypothetical protein